MVTANEEWMEECKNRSENIHIHSAGGNWRNLTSDETSNKYFWIDRTFTCIADPDHFALVRINHKMDFPSDTKNYHLWIAAHTGRLDAKARRRGKDSKLDGRESRS
ncbi:unnamed protein product, partial [Mesorhabditis belari]|uniref:Uncharacterized protein n=1 Tax=Mesorhabditis belari TaxID=2138241 RepID=A0AAF3J683_9BILA